MSSDIESVILEALRIHNHEISFCQLSETEYSTIYTEQMKKQGWRPIADATKAHRILAKDTIYALKHKGEIVATLSSAKSPAFKIAYMGFFTVNKEWRGLQLGQYLWKKVVSLLNSDGYMIEFDAPQALQNYYENLGYKIATTGTIHVLKKLDQLDNIIDSGRIQEITQENIAKVVEYDYSIMPNDNREEYLTTWINKKHTNAVCYINNDTVIGYGVMSKHVGDNKNNTYSYILAPIYAQTAEIACEIIKHLCIKASTDEPIYLDTLNYNPLASALMKSLGFDEEMSFNRMSETGILDKKRTEIISQVYALSSHGYAPL